MMVELYNPSVTRSLVGDCGSFVMIGAEADTQIVSRRGYAPEAGFACELLIAVENLKAACKSSTQLYGSIKRYRFAACIDCYLELYVTGRVNGSSERT